MNFEIIGLIIAVVGCYVSIRSENAKSRDIATADRKDLLNMIRIIEKDSKEFKEAFMQEAKDFHGRLCTLEERYLQMKERK